MNTQVAVHSNRHNDHCSSSDIAAESGAHQRTGSKKLIRVNEILISRNEKPNALPGLKITRVHSQRHSWVSFCVRSRYVGPRVSTVDLAGKTYVYYFHWNWRRELEESRCLGRESPRRNGSCVLNRIPAGLWRLLQVLDKDLRLPRDRVCLGPTRQVRGLEEQRSAADRFWMYGQAAPSFSADSRLV